ncbi:hypothetical protein BR63_05770 [Thermanaerosceptrum fracticalcis]|uniref:Uncharacterized protein n=1 Tax=Thermanaerosceptrum fracticalcis TaxID=1712410 RepID=A0A7G6E1B2_THEFR|nr:hypothetical protein [Thermanaerosceptrum fracticalcis]QNB45866.1 hypothetical protein BR63_05770 [Thermanaerosceptrum fracticalcis]
MIDIDLAGKFLSIDARAFRNRVDITLDVNGESITLTLSEDDAEALERQLEIALYDDSYHRSILEEKVLNLEQQLEQLKDELETEREYNAVLKRKLA